MNFENSISLNFPAIMHETLETFKCFKSFNTFFGLVRIDSDTYIGTIPNSFDSIRFKPRLLSE